MHKHNVPYIIRHIITQSNYPNSVDIFVFNFCLLYLQSTVEGKSILWVTGLSLFDTQGGTSEIRIGSRTDVLWFHHTPLGLDYRNYCIEIILRTIYRDHCTYSLRQKYFWGSIVVTSVSIRGNDTNIFTSVNTAPHITHDCEVVHEAVLEGNVVCLVFIFLGEYIGQI